LIASTTDKSFKLETLRLEAYLPEKRFSRRFVIGTLEGSIFATYINYYNDVRLNSAIGYIAPLAKLEGRDKQIFKDRDRKLEMAWEIRRKKRWQSRLFAETEEATYLLT
jgi:hypothetical protein